MKSLLIVTLALAPAWGQALDFNLDAVAAKAKEKAPASPRETPGPQR